MGTLLQDQEVFDRLLEAHAGVPSTFGVPQQHHKPMQPGEGALLRPDGVLDPVLWTKREILLASHRS